MGEPKKEIITSSDFLITWVVLSLILGVYFFQQDADAINGFGSYYIFGFLWLALISGIKAVFIMGIIFIIVTVIYNIANWKRPEKRPKNQPKKQPNIDPYVQALHDKQRGAKKPMTLQDFWEREKEKEKEA